MGRGHAQPLRDIAFERVADDNLLVTGQVMQFPRPGPSRFGFSFLHKTGRRPAHLSRLSVDTATTEAAPPIVHFDGWEARTSI
jgi:hypothetical protein